MKIALINNVPPIWGLGKYASKLYHSLNKKLDVDNIYINFDEKILEINNRLVKLKKLRLIDNKVLFIYRSLKLFPKADVYHLTNQNLSFIINGIKKKNLKARIVVTCHDIHRYKRPKNLFDFYLSKFLYSGLKKADVVIASTTATKNDLIKYFKIKKDKIFVIHLASDNIKKVLKIKARKKLKLPLKFKIALHIGELKGGWKNTYRVIEAIESLPKNVILVRVGKDEYKSKKVINLYKISDKDMELLYNASDVLVLPLTYDITNLPIIEAMKVGLPVITSKTSSIYEVVKDAPYYVDAFSIKSISKGIENVLKNDKIRKEIIRKGFIVGKKLTWDNTAKQVLEIYKKA